MSRQTHVLVVMGEGGHSKECLRLVELMGEDRYRYSYVLVRSDVVTERKIQSPGPIYRVIRPREKTGRLAVDAFKHLLCFAQASVAIIRSRPDAVLSTGPAVAVPVCVAAKLAGCRIIFVETGSRVRSLSTTGRLMRFIADLYFVQWEQLLPQVPRAVYAGRLF